MAKLNSEAPDPLPMAYCAPGTRELARAQLERCGNQYRDIVESAISFETGLSGPEAS